MNKDFMKLAIEEAKKSGTDVPVGAVIVKNGDIIASSHNEKEQKQDSILHAEMVAIKDASKKLQNWRLEGCEIYVTLEPCPMCAWAIIQARIPKVYFGSYDALYGALGSRIDLRELCNNIEVKGGILEQECNEILKDFFGKLR